MRKYLLFCIVAFSIANQLSAQTPQGTYTSNQETITFDSSDDGNTHGLFDPSTEPNPYSINQGYSLPTLWNGGTVPTFTNQFILGPQLPSFPSFGCSSIPGASTILDFLGLDCSDFDFPGFSMGGGLIFDMTATVEMDIDFKNFGDDSMRIVYPAKITTFSPQDNTYEAGDWVALSTDTDLDVAANPQIETYYPSKGKIESFLDFDLETDVSLGFQLNIFGFDYSLSYPIVSVGLQDFLSDVIGLEETRFPLFKVDSVRSFSWGEVNFFDPLNLPVQGWFPNLPSWLEPFWLAFPQCEFPYDQIPNYCSFGQFYDDDLPLDITAGPLTGSIDLPEVTTNLTTGQDNLYATGFDEYMRLDLSIPDLAAMIIGELPCGCIEPPVAPATICSTPATAACAAAREAVVFALEHLTFDASFDLPGFDDDLEISYALFTATLGLVQENRVNVSFSPRIFGRYEFPVPVDFIIYDSLGTQYATGLSSVINYLVGDSIIFKYPCHYTELTIDRAYNIEGNVSTNIGDSYSLQMAITAGGVAFQIPGFNLFDGYTFSESIPYPDICWSEECLFGICVDIPYPCISWYQLTVTFPAVTIPTVSFNTCEDVYSLIPGVNGVDFPTNNDDTGDCDNESGAFIAYEETLLSLDQLPGGNPVPYWYENSWVFEGFVEELGTPLILKARGFSAVAQGTNILCNGGNTGNASVTITNGNSPFTYEWTGPNNFTGTTSIISTLTSGNYFVTITDTTGCETTAGVTLSQPFPLVLNGNVTNVSCFGANTGSIQTLVSGGTGAGYSYNWSNSTTNPNATNLVAGNYNLTVTDANNCPILQSYTVTQPAQLLESVPAVITHASCFSHDDGSIDITMAGGTQPYQYNWGALGATTEDIVSLTAGVYNLTVTDLKGCTYPNSFTVNQPSDIQLSSIATAVDCFGNNTGAINLNVVGGTPMAGPTYTFAWYNHSGALSSTITEDALNLFAGNHTVIVTDAKGCSDTLTTLVNQPPQLLITNPVFQNINCFGVPTGSINITVQGGIGVPYNYNWTTTNGSGLNPTIEDQTNLGAGTYSIVAMDGNNCTTSAVYQLTQPSQALSATYSVQNVKCFGENTGSINLIPAGGTAPYNFNWTTANGSGVSAANEDQTGISSGDYTVQVTDSKGCTINMTITVAQPVQPLALSETHQNVLCNGGNSGSLNLTTVGGTSPYTYQWSNGASVILTATTEDLSNLYADNYLVVVHDANQCTSNLNVTIAQPSAPLQLSNQVVDVACFGNATGSINLSVTGGTTGYTFDWNNDGTGDNNDTEDLSNMLAGSYIINVIDNNGCQASETILISQPAQGIASTVTMNPATCFGQSNGAIDLAVNGGTAPYVYDWNNDGTGDTDDTQDLQTIASGFYTVTITDINGCIHTTGAFVSQPTNALDVNTVVVDPSCYGASNGSISLQISGGTTPYYMAWGNQSEFLLNNPSELLSGLAVGTYYFRVRDKNGCLYEESVIVNQPDTIQVANVITDALCFGSSDGTITLNPIGGTQPYSYLWSNTSTNQNQTGLSAGYYDFTLTDSQGCKYQEVLFVDQASEIIISSEIIPLSCIDEKDAAIELTTIGGTSPYIWQWSNGANTESISQLGAGNYTLLLTDANNCAVTKNYVISTTNTECVNPVNTFTPNNDNYNDTWIIDNIELYPNAEVSIFNRWGNLLYQTKGQYIPWDGRFKGNPLPAEVYYYIIKLNNGIDNQYDGTVTIVR
jgi:gliding motility-associated-like protein